jgi:hypothetical protein
MNEKIDAKHGKMVGMVCRPATHHFMCSAIGVGWYAVVLLVSLLVANLVVLDIDTMVAGWIGAHLLGLATHVGKCIHAFSLPCVVHHFSCMWSEGVYKKFIEANVVHGPVQTIVAPMRVDASPCCADDEANCEWAEYIEVPASSLNSCFL